MATSLAASFRRDATLPLAELAAKIVRNGLALATAPLYLRACTAVGRLPRTAGRPLVRNEGRIAVGDDCIFNSQFAPVALECGPRGAITIGDGAFLNYGAHVHAERSVEIGRGALIGAYAVISDDDGMGDARPIRIGDHAWLTGRVTVLPGSDVGEGAAITPGSVVDGVIPPWAIAAGVPARVVRFRESRDPPQKPVPQGRALAGWLRAGARRQLSAAWLSSCDRVGQGAILEARPFVRNLGWIEIGRDFRLSSAPIQSHLVSWHGGRLVIGDGVRIGHGAAISASAFVEMNDRSVAGPFLTVLDDSYHHESGRARPRPVHIGRDVVLGANVTVLPGASIGDGARVLAGSTVSGQVAAGATVSGIPAQAR